jgi:alanine dehydrogenase
MEIGIPAETKSGERRIALDPAGAEMVINAGHRLMVQTGAGAGAGFADHEYEAVGAYIAAGPDEVWSAEMVLKVKEPQPAEFKYFRPGLKLFCYLHLAAEPELTRALVDSGTEAHAFETVQEGSRLPLLAPMSEIAGRAATIFGAATLAEGSGVLLSGATGVPPATVLVVGAGIAGTAAARSAHGQDANVIAADVDLDRLHAVHAARQVSATIMSSRSHIGTVIGTADLVIGAALVPADRAPVVICRDHLKRMRPGSVFVDLAIDQGGCAETSRPTSLDDPTYVEEGVIHYCVTNVPGQYPQTASRALSAAVARRVTRLASDRTALQGSCNVIDGRIAHPTVRLAVGSCATEA